MSRHPHAEIAKLWFEDTSRRVEYKITKYLWEKTKSPNWELGCEYRFAAPIDSNGNEMYGCKKYRSRQGDEFFFNERRDNFTFSTSKGCLYQWELDGAEPVETEPKQMAFTGGVPDGFRLLEGNEFPTARDYVLSGRGPVWDRLNWTGATSKNAIVIRRIKRKS
ncbi:MAG TPA: hypothetical protein PLA71_00045 [Saccharofermentans sp.]|nr:hypothetical protein [Saccharofermentans sp.]